MINHSIIRNISTIPGLREVRERRNNVTDVTSRTLLDNFMHNFSLPGRIHLPIMCVCITEVGLLRSSVVYFRFLGFLLRVRV